MGSNLQERSCVKCFGGYQKVFSHDSAEVKTKMVFAIYLPPKAATEKCPALYWLSGLTCSEQNLITKGGFQRVASELGLIVVCPDTSPRDAGIEGENDCWDFGTAAAYYVDATEKKWKTNYRMFSYVNKELLQVIADNFPVLSGRQSICGHSVGGHGALISALRNPGLYQSVSVFAPMCNPMNCGWGQKAFQLFLGEDKETWKKYDACELVKTYNGPKMEILVDQGAEDGFIKQNQLLGENLVQVCEENELLQCNYRLHDGYDHGYYFIATFIEEHLRYHFKALSM